MSTEDKQHWDIIIEPHKKFFDMDWKGILRYKDLLFLLLKRDFVAFYNIIIYSVAFSIFIFFLGVFTFNKAEKTFIDTV